MPSALRNKFSEKYIFSSCAMAQLFLIIHRFAWCDFGTNPTIFHMIFILSFSPISLLRLNLEWNDYFQMLCFCVSCGFVICFSELSELVFLPYRLSVAGELFCSLWLCIWHAVMSIIISKNYSIRLGCPWYEHMNIYWRHISALTSSPNWFWLPIHDLLCILIMLNMIPPNLKWRIILIIIHKYDSCRKFPVGF